MTPSVSIISLDWTAFCILAFLSPSSHGLNKEGHMGKIFTNGLISQHTEAFV